MKAFRHTLMMTLASVLAFGGLLAVPGSAQADQPAFEDALYVATESPLQNPSANLVMSMLFGLKTQDGRNHGVPGIVVHASVSSCGRFIKEATQINPSGDTDRAGVMVNFSPNGELDASPNRVNRLVGKSIDYVITVTHPGFDPYTLTGTYDGYNVRRPSCAKIQAGLDGDDGSTRPKCNVSSWSKKVRVPGVGTKPVVGSNVRVSPTRTNCKVAYKWVANGAKIGNRRTVRLEPSRRGTSLAMKVKVYKAGFKPRTKKIPYGRIRPR